MNLLGLTNPAAASTDLLRGAGELSRTRSDSQESFLSVLGRKATRPGVETPSPEKAAREAAAQLVAISLVKPILAQARAARSAAPPFGQTQGERQFGGMLDGMLADRLVSASRWPLVDRLARDMLKHAPGAALDAPAQEDPKAPATSAR